MKEKIYENLGYLICMAFCFICLILYFFFISSKEEVLEEEPITIEEEKPKEIVMVDLKGAVVRPGIYEVEEGDRVQNVIEQNGGLLENADTDSLNLSQKVTDEMVIFVPYQGEESSISYEEGKININTATLEELLTIPGIGETKAEAILEYRETQKFQSIEDIQKVNGIGSSTFEKIKDSIMV